MRAKRQKYLLRIILVWALLPALASYASEGKLILEHKVNLESKGIWINPIVEDLNYHGGIGFSNHYHDVTTAGFISFRVAGKSNCFVGLTVQNWSEKKEHSDFGLEVLKGEVNVWVDGVFTRRIGKVTTSTEVVTIKFPGNGNIDVSIDGRNVYSDVIPTRNLANLPANERKFIPYLLLHEGLISLPNTDFKVTEKAVEWPYKMGAEYAVKNNLLESTVNFENGGQIAANYLPGFKNGVFRFVGPNDNKKHYYGLSYRVKVNEYKEFDFCVRTSITGGKNYFLIYVDGKGIGDGYYRPGDDFVIQKRDGKVEIRVNGVIRYRTTSQVDWPLFVHALADRPGTVFEKMFCSFGVTPIEWGVKNGLDSDYNGRLTSTTLSSNSEMSTRLAVSKRKIKATESVFIEMHTDKRAGAKFIGFAIPKADLSDLANFEHLLRLEDGRITYYELGFEKQLNTSAISFTHHRGDVFRMLKVNGQIKLLKNGVVFHSGPMNTANASVAVVASLSTNSSLVSLASDIGWGGVGVPYNPFGKFLADFAIPVREPDGNFYRFKSHIRVVYKEEYNVSDKPLSFKIFDNAYQEMSCSPEMRSIGDNRIEIPISSCGLTNEAYYLLELENDKKEKRYVRFYYDNGVLLPQGNGGSGSSGGGTLSNPGSAYEQWAATKKAS